MIKAPEDDFLELYEMEDKGVIEEENKKYTINGQVLDTKSRVLHDLTSIRIHLIDFGFDELESSSYSYIKDEIERCHNNIDEGKLLEAAVRVVSMQFLMGIDIGMKTVLRGIVGNKLLLPNEFFGEVPQSMLLMIASKGDSDLKTLSDGFMNNSGYGEDGIIKKRGNK